MPAASLNATFHLPARLARFSKSVQSWDSSGKVSAPADSLSNFEDSATSKLAETMGFWSLVSVLRYHHATANPPATAEAAETSPKPKTLDTLLLKPGA